jgi:glucosamine--fructose-6-phosphate aminotransferase (isomerizing)
MGAGEFTRLEIDSQADVWTATVEKMAREWPANEAALAGARGRPFIVIGCGSTYYLAQHAASLLRSVGFTADAFPSSELALFPQEHLPADFVLLAISRSGTTTETLWAMDAYRAHFPSTGLIIIVTCVPGTPMVGMSDVVLLSEFAQEQSVAQTRSFTSMALMCQVVAALLSGDRSRMQALARLPQLLVDLLARNGNLPEQLGSDLSIDRLFYLGSGPFYGLACEAMLKTKEMTVSWSEAYHVLEFRHGPMSVVAPSALIVGMISDSAAQSEIDVLREMKALGGRTLAICEERGTLDWSGVDTVVELQSGLDEWQRPVLVLPLIQWLAFYRALAKGLDPDNPQNLTQVIVLQP